MVERRIQHEEKSSAVCASQPHNSCHKSCRVHPPVLLSDMALHSCEQEWMVLSVSPTLALGDLAASIEEQEQLMPLPRKISCAKAYWSISKTNRTMAVFTN